jgi:hypothetical protein
MAETQGVSYSSGRLLSFGVILGLKVLKKERVLNFFGRERLKLRGEQIIDYSSVGWADAEVVVIKC